MERCLARQVDAYLRVRVGGRTIFNTRDRYHKDCFNTVPFYETFETTVKLPGDAIIALDVYATQAPCNDARPFILQHERVAQRWRAILTWQIRPRLSAHQR